MISQIVVGIALYKSTDHQYIPAMDMKIRHKGSVLKVTYFIFAKLCYIKLH